MGRLKTHSSTEMNGCIGTSWQIFKAQLTLSFNIRRVKFVRSDLHTKCHKCNFPVIALCFCFLQFLIVFSIENVQKHIQGSLFWYMGMLVISLYVFSDGWWERGGCLG